MTTRTRSTKASPAGPATPQGPGPERRRVAARSTKASPAGPATPGCGPGGVLEETGIIPGQSDLDNCATSSRRLRVQCPVSSAWLEVRNESPGDLHYPPGRRDLNWPTLKTRRLRESVVRATRCAGCTSPRVGTRRHARPGTTAPRWKVSVRTPNGCVSDREHESVWTHRADIRSPAAGHHVADALTTSPVVVVTRRRIHLGPRVVDAGEGLIGEELPAQRLVEPRHLARRCR